MDRFDLLLLELSELGIHCEVRTTPDGDKAADAFVSAMRTRFQFIARLEEDDNLLCVHCLSSCRVPAGALVEAVQLANRINPCLNIGSLILDRDSDLVFKAASYVTDETLGFAIKQMAMWSACVLDTFEPAFQSQIYGNATIEEAFHSAMR